MSERYTIQRVSTDFTGMRTERTDLETVDAREVDAARAWHRSTLPAGGSEWIEVRPA